MAKITFTENNLRWDVVGVAPLEGEKTSGHEPGDKYPADLLNYRFNQLYQFLQDAIDVVNENDDRVINASHYEPNDLVGVQAPVGLLDTWVDNSWLGAVGTFSEDTVNKLTENGLKATLNATNAGIHVETAMDLTLLADGDASSTSDFINFAIFIATADLVNIDNSTNIFRVEFFNDALGVATNYFRYRDIDKADITADEFNFFEIKKSDFESIGSPSWDSITGADLRVEGTVSGPVNFTVDKNSFQLVKADPDDSNIPSYFQKNDVRIFDIDNGKWYLGIENGINVWKPLSTPLFSAEGLSGQEIYNNFTLTYSIVVDDTTNVIPINWGNDNNNYISGYMASGKIRLRKVESSVITNFDLNTSAQIGDRIDFVLEKDGIDVILHSKINGIEQLPLKTTTTLTSGTMNVGVSNVSRNSIFNIGITELRFSFRSRQADLAIEVQNTHVDYTPTLTFTGTPPSSITTVARYNKIGNRVNFNISLSSVDGNGATNLQISLPVTPKDNNSIIAVTAQEKVDTTWSDPLGYIDDDAGNGIEFRNFSTATDAVAWEMIISGSYEV